MKININSILTIVATGLIAFSVSQINKLEENLIAGGLIVIVAAVIVFLLKEVLLFLIDVNKFERKIEGSWFAILTHKENERTAYVFATIDYDFFTKEMVYSGFSFNEKVEPIGEWRSTHVFIDGTKKNIRYLYEGHEYNREKGPQTGFGIINFTSLFRKNHVSATGIFRSATNDYKPRYYHLKKLNDEKIKKLMGADKIVDLDGVTELVKKIVAELVEK